MGIKVALIFFLVLASFIIVPAIVASFAEKAHERRRRDQIGLHGRQRVERTAPKTKDPRSDDFYRWMKSQPGPDGRDGYGAYVGDPHREVKQFANDLNDREFEKSKARLEREIEIVKNEARVASTPADRASASARLHAKYAQLEAERKKRDQLRW